VPISARQQPAAAAKAIATMMAGPIGHRRESTERLFRRDKLTSRPRAEALVHRNVHAERDTSQNAMPQVSGWRLPKVLGAFEKTPARNGAGGRLVIL
jgi:hypothetical protein